ncbi:hypothetical protein [Kordia jejudonensis]|uniref:hypothetical protein n=1 Tax=Kordia jejudonensis TaxID=1348245 RepID=UPI0006290672|nr:hypothetical protein [Kordia jejudonensis]
MLKKSKSLRQKLKEAVTDLTVDIFGYQKKISDNIISHTGLISKQIMIPKERLFLKVFQKDHIIKAFIFNQSRAIQVVPIKKLAHFFMDRESANIPSFQNKIAFGIKKYLKDFSEENNLDVEAIDVWIHVKDDKIMIQAFSSDQFIQDISISSLIKFFR